MTNTTLAFLVPLLLGLLLTAAAYSVILLTIDAQLTAWKRRRRDRLQLREELERIDRDAAASVQRIGAAFAAAQQLIRGESFAGRRGDR